MYLTWSERVSCCSPPCKTHTVSMAHPPGTSMALSLTAAESVVKSRSEPPRFWRVQIFGGGLKNMGESFRNNSHVFFIRAIQAR